MKEKLCSNRKFQLLFDHEFNLTHGYDVLLSADLFFLNLSESLSQCQTGSKLFARLSADDKSRSTQ